MSKLHQFRKTGGASPGRPCPPPALWGELAAGLMTRETVFEYLEHAGNCSACAEELQYALFAIGDSSPIPEEIRQHLKTGTEEWQRKFAEQLAARQTSRPPNSAAHPGQSGGLRRFLSRVWTRIMGAGGNKPSGG